MWLCSAFLTKMRKSYTPNPKTNGQKTGWKQRQTLPTRLEPKFAPPDLSFPNSRLFPSISGPKRCHDAILSELRVEFREGGAKPPLPRNCERHAIRGSMVTAKAGRPMVFYSPAASQETDSAQSVPCCAFRGRTPNAPSLIHARKKPLRRRHRLACR
jgi:hypothetical protein